VPFTIPKLTRSQARSADLASRGSNLILTARSKDRLEALAAELRAVRRKKVEVSTLDLAVNGARPMPARIRRESNDRHSS
jgi:short-subunit dehydrogenase